MKTIMKKVKVLKALHRYLDMRLIRLQYVFEQLLCSIAKYTPFLLYGSISLGKKGTLRQTDRHHNFYTE